MLESIQDPVRFMSADYDAVIWVHCSSKLCKVLVLKGGGGVQSTAPVSIAHLESLTDRHYLQRINVLLQRIVEAKHPPTMGQLDGPVARILCQEK